MGEYVRFFLRGPLAMERADRSPLWGMRRAAIQTAVSASAANTTLLIRTMTMEAESKAGGLVRACQAYAKRAPPVSARICRSPQPGRRDHTVIVIKARASITKKVSVLPAAVGIHGATTRMLAAMAAKMPTIHGDGARAGTVWRSGTPGGPAMCQQYAGDDQDDGNHGGTEQIGRGRHVPIVRPRAGKSRQHAEHVEHCDDNQSRCTQPRRCATIREHALDKGYRGTDAPNDVQAEHVHRPRVAGPSAVSLDRVIARMWRAWTGSWDADGDAAHLLVPR